VLIGGDGELLRCAVGPAEFEMLDWAIRGDEQGSAALGPVALAGADFLCGAFLAIGVSCPENCADAVRIGGTGVDGDAQAGVRSSVAIKLRVAEILGAHQVEAAVVIEIAEGGTATFAVDFEAAGFGREWSEFAGAVAEEEERFASVVAGRVFADAEEILVEEEVLVSIGIYVPDGEAEGGRELGREREWTGVEF